MTIIDIPLLPSGAPQEQILELYNYLVKTIEKLNEILQMMDKSDLENKERITEALKRLEDK